jgi:hypothetical protein
MGRPLCRTLNASASVNLAIKQARMKLAAINNQQSAFPCRGPDFTARRHIHIAWGECACKKPYKVRTYECGRPFSTPSRGIIKTVAVGAPAVAVIFIFNYVTMYGVQHA